MIKVTIIYFLIAHFAADYYFQSEQLSESKTSNIKHFLMHALIYQLLMLVPFLVMGLNLWHLLIGLLLGVSHLVIDFIKNKLLKGQEKTNIFFYLFDQALHIFIIIVLGYFLGAKRAFLACPCIINYSIRNIQVLKWLLLGLVIFKPANVTYKIIYQKLKPKENDGENPATNGGAIIGNYERLLYCLCLAFSQYTLIGLIITCKGFARHSYIQSKPEFAEYFLIGTFYSILYAVFSYFIIMKIF